VLSIVADTHTHTIACNHAFSTLLENAVVAAKKGLKVIALTEHGPGLSGSPSPLYFQNMRVIPRYLHGVMILKGVEANILDYNGSLDLEDSLLSKLELVIASYHTPIMTPATMLEHTNGWMRIANNPHVDIIGHCGTPYFDFEYLPVIREFARTGKIVEINNNSTKERPGSDIPCRKIAELCAEHNVPVVVSSDAHFCEDVGRFDISLKILRDIGFPNELVLNADYDRFINAVSNVSGKNLTD